MSIPPLTLNAKPAVLHWAALIGATLAFVALFRLAGLPAALLLGAIAGAILVASFEGRVHIPPRSFLLAQAVIGCLVAKAIGAASLGTMLKQWPIFLIGIGAVMAFAAGLGVILARWKVLPGTTAIWGSSPGAATAMVLMAEAFGADIRLVAVMQYLRVAFVGLIASIVAREWAAPGAVSPVPPDWFPALAPLPFLATLAIAVGGAVIGVKSKIPAGPLLVTLVIATVLAAAHLVTITLPPWLLAACYAAVGWSIDFRFTRPMVAYAARQLPRIVASIVTLIVLCGGLAYALHVVVGTDPLTAYLATSPGGADSVAIIAASSKVDLPFVMTMQIGRAVVAILIGPALARFLVRWAVDPAATSPRTTASP
jgi:membrane AbrB-like protein